MTDRKKKWLHLFITALGAYLALDLAGVDLFSKAGGLVVGGFLIMYIGGFHSGVEFVKQSKEQP